MQFLRRVRSQRAVARQTRTYFSGRFQRHLDQKRSTAESGWKLLSSTDSKHWSRRVLPIGEDADFSPWCCPCTPVCTPRANVPRQTCGGGRSSGAEIAARYA